MAQAPERVNRMKDLNPADFEGAAFVAFIFKLIAAAVVVLGGYLAWGFFKNHENHLGFYVVAGTVGLAAWCAFFGHVIQLLIGIFGELWKMNKRA